MSYFLNLESLLLGLLAWVIPIVALCRFRTAGNAAGLAAVSFGACALSLVLQVFELRHRVHLEDWSALMDTVDAVALAAVTLLAVAALLNAAAWIVCRKRS